MRRHFQWLFVSILLIGLTSSFAALAQSRVALVIGNSSYQNVPPLPNPINDAKDISASLKQLGFDVNILTDATFDDIRRSLMLFGQQARGAEVAVVFFAGHGMEIGGENWLIPVDAHLQSDLDIENETISLRSLMRAVSSTEKLGLVILDACRNNPFLPKMQMHRTTMTRAVDRGFVRVEPNENVLVAYSARDGTTATGGTGRNSPFTSSLLRNIATPGLEVRFLFATVRDEVMATTHRQQQPFIYGSLSKNLVYLNSNQAAMASPSAQDSVRPAPPPALASLPPPGDSVITSPPAVQSAGLTPSKQFLGPTFRCTGPLSRDEQTICRSPALASLDVELDSVYSTAKQTTANQTALVAAQKAWIARRKTCFTDETCIASLYRNRIAELKSDSRTTARPSFACAGTLSPDERAICESPQLSILDQQLNTAFETAKGHSRSPTLVREQRNWLAKRASCSGESECIAALYRQRILELSNAR